MLKKVIVLTMILLMIIGMSTVYATTGEEVLNSDQAAEIVSMKESSKAKVQDYIEKYGSTPYGVAAYILNILRIYSIPCCFIGIAVGSIYQYVLGIRKLDTRDKGFALIVTFVTILLICQVLPLIFAIVVNFWRG
ncbi:MAG: hypothetical protein J6A36_02170 [Clostridia bacterium]|nr:hypothetical protein [Clostridia bacterium]